MPIEISLPEKKADPPVAPNKISIELPGAGAQERLRRALTTGEGIGEFAPPPPPPQVELREAPVSGFIADILARARAIPRRQASLLKVLRATLPEKGQEVGFVEAKTGVLPVRPLPAGPKITLTPEEEKEAVAGALDIATLLPAARLVQLGRAAAGRVFFRALERLGPRGAQAAARSIRTAADVAAFEAVFPSLEQASSIEGRLEAARQGAEAGAVLGPTVGVVGDAVGGLLLRLAARPAAQKALFKLNMLRLQSKLSRQLEPMTPEQLQTTSIEAAESLQKLTGDVTALLGEAGKLVEAQAKTIAQTGTVAVAAKPAARRIARELGGAESLRVSARLIEEMQGRTLGVVAATRALGREFERRAATGADLTKSRALLERAGQVEEQVSQLFLKARRSAGLALLQLKKPPQAFKAALEGSLGELNFLVQSYTRQLIAPGRQLSVVERFILDMRQSTGLKDEFVAFSRLGVDWFRTNVFPLFSAGLDLLSNSIATTSVGFQGFTADLFDAFTAQPGFFRTRGMLAALTSRARLAEQIRTGVGRTAFGERLLGERGGLIGKDFVSFLLPERDGTRFVEVSNRVVNALDTVISAPALAKTAIDDQFKRYGALSLLYEEAIKRASAQGLRGVSRTSFIRELINNPTADMVEAAIGRAGVTGFNRMLTDVEERAARSILVKAFITPFPRWNFQIMRFVAEHSPVDPAFWRKVFVGQATSEDFIKFLARNFEGVAALQFVEENIYPHLDSFLNYRREDGRSIPLGFIEPIPQVVLILAALKGDGEMASRALRNASIFGTRIQGVFDVPTWIGLFSGQESLRNKAQGRVEAFIDGMIPARGVRRVIETILDPEATQGPLRNVPFFSRYGLPVIDPTTGEVRMNVVNVLGSIGPDIGIPLVPRETNRVEAEIEKLRRLAVAARTSGMDIPLPGRRRPTLGPDAEKALTRIGVNLKSTEFGRIQNNFERMSGRIFARQFLDAIASPDWETLTLETKASFVNGLSRKANAEARMEMLVALGATPEPRLYEQMDAILRELSGDGFSSFLNEELSGQRVEP